MQEFRSVEIDLDVHKRIELAREGFSETPNAVLRRLLGVDMPRSVQPPIGAKGMRSWSGKGVQLPHGTRVRMDYNGRKHEGEIVDGSWLVEGDRFGSPSAAAGGVARTKSGKRTNLDGWIYWWALLPGHTSWVKLADMRPRKLGVDPVTPEKDEGETELEQPRILGGDLPAESVVMDALESLLKKRKGEVTPSEAYKALAEEFGLTLEQRTRLMDNGKDCHWENRVRFARRKLVDAGIMAREPRGIWSLSNTEANLQDS